MLERWLIYFQTICLMQVNIHFSKRPHSSIVQTKYIYSSTLRVVWLHSGVVPISRLCGLGKYVFPIYLKFKKLF